MAAGFGGGLCIGEEEGAGGCGDGCRRDGGGGGDGGFGAWRLFGGGLGFSDIQDRPRPFTRRSLYNQTLQHRLD